MEMRNFLRALWRWSWLILLGIAAGVGSSFYALYSLGQVPVYEAEALVDIGTEYFVTNRSDENLAPTYVELATLQSATQAVIDELQLSLKPEELTENLQVGNVRGTRYVRIVAVAHDPNQAADIANATARQLVQTPHGLRHIVEIVEPASPPDMPSLRPFVAVFIAGFFGMFLALGIAFLLERLNDRIRTMEDVTYHLGLPVFGVVQPTPSLPDLVRQPVWWTAIEGCRHTWNGAGPGTGQPIHKRLLVTSPGQSEGKTTTAIGLAAACARAGLNVALVEAHLDRPALSQRLNVSGSSGLAGLLNGDALHLEPVPLGGVYTGKLQVLAVDKAVQEPLDLVPSPQFQQALEDISRQVDLLIIDAPPVLSAAETPILAAKANGVLLVVQARKTRLKALKEALKTVDLVGGTVLGVLFCERKRLARGHKWQPRIKSSSRR
jgi:succinoglycan biosynthesis transport protein ExoP